MTKTNKKSKNTRKLLGAVGMLTVSAAMLVSSTFAWFTMNKTVKATAMEVKAHAEEGLLINEKAAPGNTWDDIATAAQTDVAQAIQLRPASTSNLADWWHANSKKTNSEAGAGTNGVDTDNTVAISNGVYYSDIKPGATGMAVKTTDAAEGTQAETNVYYKDATYGTPSQYDNGEGYYVEYKYYIKSSGSATLSVAKNKFMVNVEATKKNEAGATDSVKLDPALRVGVKIGTDTLIFAPVDGATTGYKVAGSTAGTTYADVTAKTAETAIGTTGSIDIPAVTANGMEVDVYVWFEGEDPACKSENLTAVLDTYNIDITFRDADFT